MNKRSVDPSRLEGAALDQWYRRTPEEIEEERRRRDDAAHDDFYGGDSWEEARIRPPPAPPPMRVVPDTPIAPPVRGAPPPVGARGSFFGSVDPLPFGDEYLPDLPAPLDHVEPSLVMRDMYVLSDGTIVSGKEVERIYAEQQRRIRGQDLAPTPYARAVDRLEDGKVPTPEQLEKGTWERDPTCHPYGGWEVDPGFPYYPKRSQDYEAQVTGARGVDYVVRLPGQKRGVKFDGCDVENPRHPLQEAKGPGYAGLLDRAWRSTFRPLIVRSLQGQAERQSDVAGGRPIDWYVAEKPAMDRIQDEIVVDRPIQLKHVPAR